MSTSITDITKDLNHDNRNMPIGAAQMYSNKRNHIICEAQACKKIIHLS